MEPPRGKLSKISKSRDGVGRSLDKERPRKTPKKRQRGAMKQGTTTILHVDVHSSRSVVGMDEDSILHLLAQILLYCGYSSKYVHIAKF